MESGGRPLSVPYKAQTVSFVFMTGVVFVIRVKFSALSTEKWSVEREGEESNTFKPSYAFTFMSERSYEQIAYPYPEYITVIWFMEPMHY